MASATTTPHRKFLRMVPPNGQARWSRAMAERWRRVAARGGARRALGAVIGGPSRKATTRACAAARSGCPSAACGDHTPWRIDPPCELTRSGPPWAGRSPGSGPKSVSVHSIMPNPRVAQPRGSRKLVGCVPRICETAARRAARVPDLDHRHHRPFSRTPSRNAHCGNGYCSNGGCLLCWRSAVHVGIRRSSKNARRGRPSGLAAAPPRAGVLGDLRWARCRLARRVPQHAPRCRAMAHSPGSPSSGVFEVVFGLTVTLMWSWCHEDDFTPGILN